MYNTILKKYIYPFTYCNLSVLGNSEAHHCSWYTLQTRSKTYECQTDQWPHPWAYESFRTNTHRSSSTTQVVHCTWKHITHVEGESCRCQQAALRAKYRWTHSDPQKINVLKEYLTQNWKLTPSKISFFIRTDFEKCSITSLIDISKHWNNPQAIHQLTSYEVQ